MTKYAAISLFLSFATAGPAMAQSSGYAFAGFGRETGYSSYFHPGIGGDWLIKGGLGVGGEVGAVTARRAGAPNLALISGNASYHVPVAAAGIIDPFVTGGISMVTTGGGGDLLWNWGGGANWWLRPRLGLRLEVRDHVWTAASRHLVEFRIGVCFR